MLIAPELTKAPAFPPLPEDNAVGTAGQELRTTTEKQLQLAVMDTVFWAATVMVRRALSRLFELTRIRSNWDSYGAPSPNETAFQNAVRILKLMQPFDLEMANIVPSAEGGIGFCFTKGDRYADIESSNEGEILGVRYVGMAAPVLIQTDGTDVSIKAALEEVRGHING